MDRNPALTRSQFAAAVRADEKWVENTARVLGRQLAYTPQEARYFGIVRLLANQFGIPVARAARLADEAIEQPPDSHTYVLDESADGSAALLLDLSRYHSGFAAALATALHRGGPRRAGRPVSVREQERKYDRIGAAERHGVDISLLRQSLTQSPAERLARLDANAAFLRSLRPTKPRARRAPSSLVFVLGAQASHASHSERTRGAQ
jgi:hypothetical protein